MTREQKIEWAANASTWQLIGELESFARKHAVLNERYGCFDQRVLNAKDDGDIIKAELQKRLG